MSAPSDFSGQRLGYLIHTNRELGLMLAGKKPLAIMYDLEGQFHPVVVRYLRMFDRYVSLGRFVRQERKFPTERYGEPLNAHYIYYALPNEVWRISEMMELQAGLRSGRPWAEADELKMGALLGYTPEQNEIWIRLWRARQFSENQDS